MSERELDYWKDGTCIIGEQLRSAVLQANSENWYSHAPVGLSPEQAAGWLAGRVDAMRHCLEIMGWSEEIIANPTKE